MTVGANSKFSWRPCRYYW